MPDLIEHGARERPRRVGASRRLLAGAVVVLLAASAVTAAVVSGRTDSDSRVQPRDRAARTSPLSAAAPTLSPLKGARLIASVAVPAGGASAALLTPTTAWFASWSQGRLLAIDRKSLQVRTVRVGQPNNGPLSMTYGGGALWVVDFADAALLKLNPATGALLARRVLHDGGEVGAVAYANDFVWLGVSGLLGSGSAREHLLKLHPRTLATVATLDLPGEGEDLQLASSGTVLWVAGAMSPVAIDTLTGRAVMRLPDDGETAPVGGGVLWTAGAAGLRSRDADTGRRVTDVALNGSATVLAVGPRGEAWIAGPPLRMIQRTGRSYLLPQSGSVDATAVDNSTLWVHTARHVLVFDIAHLVR